MQTRREFIFKSLPTMALAVALGTAFTAGCKRKRTGSFEESAKAIIKWVKNKDFNISLKEFNDFKDKLSFHIDNDVNSAVEKVIAKKSTEEFVKKNGWVFCIQPEAKAVANGEIISNSKFDGGDVYFLKNVTGEGEGMMGRTLGGVALVYVSNIEKHVVPEPITYEWLSKFFNIPMELLNKYGEQMTIMLRQEKTDIAEFDLLYRHVTSEYGISDDRLAKMLWYLKLAIMDMKSHNKFENEADKIRGKKEFVYNVTIHELVHPRLADLNMVGNETLCVLTDLAYGARQHYRLSNLLLMAVSHAAPETARAAVTILETMQARGFTVEKSIRGLSEDEIKSMALEILNSICFSLTDKRYDQLVNVSLFDEARTYIFTNLQL